jgi:DNA-directed RNA polymerase subunit K/omega
MQAHNYDEIDVLATIVRDANGLIVDPLHRTFPFITKYEKARVLGERAKQLNSGAKALVEVEPTVIDGYLIALKEYEAKKIPFIIKRPLPNGGCEYWRFRDLELLI